jgi:hypothetical protein
VLLVEVYKFSLVPLETRFRNVTCIQYFELFSCCPSKEETYVVKLHHIISQRNKVRVLIFIHIFIVLFSDIVFCRRFYFVEMCKIRSIEGSSS